MAENQIRGTEGQDCPAIRVTQSDNCPAIRVRLAGGGCDGSIAVLNEHTTTVKTGPDTTADYISNDAIRIRGNDGNDYTLAEWNALFAAAGYDKEAMSVQPVGMRLQLFDTDEVYLFDRYEGVTYSPAGDAAGLAGRLHHSIYNNNLVADVSNGTDFTTGKEWTVTDNGDNFVLYEENTKQSWTIAKDTYYADRHRAWNIVERVQSLWAQNEWMRHRMAIDSGLTTSEVDGTMAEVSILNASGAQAAAGEDMYFWIGGTNTNILAKYNLNNRHTINSANLTQAIADALYARQKANGINMNDTGVNSGDKPILAPGSKGAEAIAVDGKWMIITPFISNPNAATASITNNVADSPAVYWAVHKGCALPSDTLLDAMYLNYNLCIALVNYLNNVEGWGVLAIPHGEYIWTAVRAGVTNCWFANLVGGSIYNTNIYIRYAVVGASAF